MRATHDERQPVGRSAGALFEAPESDQGALEVIDHVTDVLGEHAAVALLRYAAEATVMGRLSAPHPGNGQHAPALQVAARVSQAALRTLVETEQALEVEAAPGPALDGLRRALVSALCRGAVEGAFKVTHHAQRVEGRVTEDPDGRLRISLARGS